jgi:hypothetical protein
MNVFVKEVGREQMRIAAILRAICRFGAEFSYDLGPAEKAANLLGGDCMSAMFVEEIGDGVTHVGTARFCDDGDVKLLTLTTKAKVIDALNEMGE